MAEARGTNSPKNGDGPLRKTGNQSSLIWKAPSSATPAPRTWRRSPHRSCARTAREARATCAPSCARWPGPSRRRRYGRSTAPLTPSRSTRLANSSTSSAKRFVHRSQFSGAVDTRHGFRVPAPAPGLWVALIERLLDAEANGSPPRLARTHTRSAVWSTGDHAEADHTGTSPS